MKSFCATLSLALLGSSLVSGQMRPVHQLSVELKTTIYMPAGTNELYSFTNQFSVELGRSWWRISSRDVQNGLPPGIGGNPISHMEVAGDYRSRTYRIMRFDGSETPMPATDAEGNPITAVWTHGEVSPTPYPQEHGFGILPLWYAFGSGRYLEQQNHAELVSAWDVHLPNQPTLASNTLYKAEVAWLTGSDGLPAGITFASDGTYFEHELDPNEGIVAKKKTYSRPYNKEFIIANYTVDDTLKFGNKTYPKIFSLRVSKPFETAAGQELLVSKVLTGRVTSQSASEESSEKDNLMAHLPAITERTRVEDYAVGRGIAVSYYATNYWKLEGEKELTDTAMGHMLAHHASQTEEKPWWVNVLLLIGVALMGLLGTRYIVSKRRNNQT